MGTDSPSVRREEDESLSEQNEQNSGVSPHCCGFSNSAVTGSNAHDDSALEMYTKGVSTISGREQD